MKTISVVVPVYKVEAYIADTVKSLIGQTYKDFELIIIDDGSPDHSAIIAEEMLRPSGMDYQIIHKQNGGVSSARNSGIEQAKGKYILMVDGDDALESNFLEVYAGLIRAYPESDVYSTSFTVYQEDKIVEQPKLEKDIMCYSKDEAMVSFFYRNPRFLLPTLLLSAGFIRENSLFFDENVRYSEDVHFIWRVLAHNKKPLIHSSYSGYKYIMHPGSTMTSSGTEKILTWEKGFERLDTEIHYLLPISIQESFVPVSYFSILHGASKSSNYSAFKEIYNRIEAEKRLNFNGLSVHLKIRTVTILLKYFPYLGFIVMKNF